MGRSAKALTAPVSLHATRPGRPAVAASTAAMNGVSRTERRSTPRVSGYGLAQNAEHTSLARPRRRRLPGADRGHRSTGDRWHASTLRLVSDMGHPVRAELQRVSPPERRVIARVFSAVRGILDRHIEDTVDGLLLRAIRRALSATSTSLGSRLGVRLRHFDCPLESPIPEFRMRGSGRRRHSRGGPRLKVRRVDAGSLLQAGAVQELLGRRLHRPRAGRCGRLPACRVRATSQLVSLALGPLPERIDDLPAVARRASWRYSL